MLYLNIIVAGLLTGAVYGLMALGLSVIFGVIRVVNFAHGEMMVLAMYAAFMLNRKTGLDPLVASPLVTAALFLLGYALQRGLINRYIARPDHEQFLLLLAVATIITASLLMGFGPDARNVQLDYAYDSYEIGGVLLDKVRVLAALGAIGGVAALWAFFRFARTGKAIRACADNQVGAQVVGLDVKRLYAITFGLGGVGSMPGALLGGALVGVTEALSGFVVDPSLKSAFSFALLILVLLVRPQGL